MQQLCGFLNVKTIKKISCNSLQDKSSLKSNVLCNIFKSQRVITKINIGTGKLFSLTYCSHLYISGRIFLMNKSTSSFSPDRRLLFSSTACPAKLNRRSLSVLVQGQRDVLRQVAQDEGNDFHWASSRPMDPGSCRWEPQIRSEWPKGRPAVAPYQCSPSGFRCVLQTADYIFWLQGHLCLEVPVQWMFLQQVSHPQVCTWSPPSLLLRSSDLCTLFCINKERWVNHCVLCTLSIFTTCI